MKTSDRTIIRLFNEAAEARAEFAALLTLQRAGLYGEYNNFFVIVYRALFNSMVVHLTRLFDEHLDSASFWYLHRVEKVMIENQLAAAGLELDFVKMMSTKIKHVRDKTHAHVDKRAVHDPKQVWKDAGIKGADVKQLIDGTFKVLEGCYYERHRKRVDLPEYCGDDLRRLIDLGTRKGFIKR